MPAANQGRPLFPGPPMRSRASVLAAILLAVAPSLAQAHTAPSGWAYDAGCCGGHDCRQIADDAVEPVRRGWRVKATGEVFDDEAVRWSKDGHWHRCSVDGRDDTITFCLYRPPVGM
jgi:hypothetical protein